MYLRQPKISGNPVSSISLLSVYRVFGVASNTVLRFYFFFFHRSISILRFRGIYVEGKKNSRFPFCCGIPTPFVYLRSWHTSTYAAAPRPHLAPFPHPPMHHDPFLSHERTGHTGENGIGVPVRCRRLRSRKEAKGSGKKRNIENNVRERFRDGRDQEKGRRGWVPSPHGNDVEPDQRDAEGGLRALVFKRYERDDGWTAGNSSFPASNGVARGTVIARTDRELLSLSSI